MVPVGHGLVPEPTVNAAVQGWHRVPFLIAHRGYPAVAPENTLVGFERALQVGAEVLECDVQMSRDGVVVVFHDADVGRTTDGRGRVRELRWAELRCLDAGYPRRFGSAFRGERVPRLEEVLDLARGRAQVFIEIKAEAVGPGPGGIEARTVEAIRRAGALADTGILSVSAVALRRVRALAPGLPLGLVFRRWRRWRLLEAAVAVGAEYLVPFAARLAERTRLVGEAHRRRLRVGTYVVDSPALLARLVREGVDAVATDRIGGLLPALRALLGR